MKHLGAPSFDTETSETIPFRSPDVLFALYQNFERDWEEWIDARAGVHDGRPSTFPPMFTSRWQLRQWLTTADDATVLTAMRTWVRHPADVERDSLPNPLRAVSDTAKAVHAEAESALTPEAVKAEGFPRVWKESA